MNDEEQAIRNMEAAIDRFFASSRTDQEKLHGANELLKGLAYFNRLVAEARGIGKESHLTPQMPEEVINALDNGNWQVVEAWYRGREGRV